MFLSFLFLSPRRGSGNPLPRHLFKRDKSVIAKPRRGCGNLRTVWCGIRLLRSPRRPGGLLAMTYSGSRCESSFASMGGRKGRPYDATSRERPCAPFQGGLPTAGRLGVVPMSERSESTESPSSSQPPPLRGAPCEGAQGSDCPTVPWRWSAAFPWSKH